MRQYNGAFTLSVIYFTFTFYTSIHFTVDVIKMKAINVRHCLALFIVLFSLM